MVAYRAMASRAVISLAVERVYHYTKSGVIYGRIRSDEWIIEGEVALAPHMGWTPVREAFLRLQAEGLLRLYPDGERSWHP
jgi:DNA-binding GntR family transcriptional regulator